MANTLVILNPNAAGGKAGDLWTQIEPLLQMFFDEIVVGITRQPQDITQEIQQASQQSIKRIISVGGDGTNHAVVNALLRHQAQFPDEEPFIYGILPIGTGRDWARGIGIPLELEKSVQWLGEAIPQKIDVGLLTYDNQQQYFLNIASAGISGEISTRINQSETRRPWTFLKETVLGLLQHQPRAMQVFLDGEKWYDGKSYVVAIANGTTFGNGMKIAPNAQIDDGLFDVVLIEGMSRIEILLALKTVYDASHIHNPKVHIHQAKEVLIQSKQDLMSFELDGEPDSAMNLQFNIQPKVLQMLVRSE